MKKADLVSMVAEMADSTKVMAEKIVNGIFGTITEELSNGGQVDVSGFGKFIAMKRAARTARNPRTGEEVAVPEQMVPKFKPAKALKDSVKGVK